VGIVYRCVELMSFLVHMRNVCHTLPFWWSSVRIWHVQENKLEAAPLKIEVIVFLLILFNAVVWCFLVIVYCVKTVPYCLTNCIFVAADRHLGIYVAHVFFLSHQQMASSGQTLCCISASLVTQYSSYWSTSRICFLLPAYLCMSMPYFLYTQDATKKFQGLKRS